MTRDRWVLTCAALLAVAVVGVPAFFAIRSGNGLYFLLGLLLAAAIGGGVRR